ncbi:MAG: amino acid dehydrogenase [Gammaproteobacteria bacterium]|nr:amino acid dehydrogenase [Gammaproteobacteria bacterium]
MPSKTLSSTKYLGVFDHPEFDDHEQIAFCREPAAGLQAIIAIHNSNRGPALGGCRMWPYKSEQEGLRDVLRLSRGMTYKSALANLDLGGGKSVIIGDPRHEKTPQLMRAMGEMVEGLGGRYIAAEDSGTSVADLKTMAQSTAHVAGIQDKEGPDGLMRSGDPSPATAYGVFVGLRAAVSHCLHTDSVKGLRVAIQGVGSVGLHLARYLHQAGAQLWVTDIYPEQIQRAVDEFQATAVAVDDVFKLDVDVLSPCALGAILNDETISQLRAKAIAGAANNQLSEPRHGQMLLDRGILYAPDYAINAGGIIDIANDRVGFERERLIKQLDGIYDTLTTIFQRSAESHTPTNIVADRLAEERFRKNDKSF